MSVNFGQWINEWIAIEHPATKKLQAVLTRDTAHQAARGITTSELTEEAQAAYRVIEAALERQRQQFHDSHAVAIRAHFDKTIESVATLCTQTSAAARAMADEDLALDDFHRRTGGRRRPRLARYDELTDLARHLEDLAARALRLTQDAPPKSVARRVIERLDFSDLFRAS